MIVNKIEEIASSALFFRMITSLLKLPIYLKLEGLNLAGSIKLKTARKMIDSLIATNIIQLGKTKIIESSSGNLGIALSLVCKSYRIPFTCVTDPNTNVDAVKLMQLYGAQVICVKTKDVNGGYLGTRIQIIEQCLAEDPNLLWTNQYNNPNNPLAHQTTTAQEIDKNFAKIDYLFIGAGTTGTLMGCIQYFKSHHKQPKIIAVDAEGSITFGTPSKSRKIPGLGTSRTPPILQPELVENIILVSESETVQTCHSILKETGLLVGGSTGTVIKAIYSYKNRFKKDDVIVAISPDFGERYLDTIYDLDWIHKNIETPPGF